VIVVTVIKGVANLAEAMVEEVAMAAMGSTAEEDKAMVEATMVTATGEEGAEEEVAGDAGEAGATIRSGEATATADGEAILSMAADTATDLDLEAMGWVMA